MRRKDFETCYMRWFNVHDCAKQAVRHAEKGLDFAPFVESFNKWLPLLHHSLAIFKDAPRPYFESITDFQQHLDGIVVGTRKSDLDKIIGHRDAAWVDWFRPIRSKYSEQYWRKRDRDNKAEQERREREQRDAAATEKRKQRLKRKHCERLTTCAETTVSSYRGRDWDFMECD